MRHKQPQGPVTCTLHAVNVTGRRQSHDGLHRHSAGSAAVQQQPEWLHPSHARTSCALMMLCMVIRCRHKTAAWHHECCTSTTNLGLAVPLPSGCCTCTLQEGATTRQKQAALYGSTAVSTLVLMHSRTQGAAAGPNGASASAVQQSLLPSNPVTQQPNTSLAGVGTCPRLFSFLTSSKTWHRQGTS